MCRIALAFLAGVVSIQQFAHLPPPAWAALGGAGLLVALARGRTGAGWWFLAGLVWALWRGHLALAGGLPVGLTGMDLVVTGQVADMPDSRGPRPRFDFDPETLQLNGRQLAVPGRLRLRVYDPEVRAHAGERWRLAVRLRPARGLANPAGFDYEAHLFSQGIRATGYIRASPLNQRLGTGSGRAGLQVLREAVSSRVAQRLGARPGQGIVVALVSGQRAYISAGQWDLLRRTGISHLVAISGLHIGLLSGLAFFVLRRAWSRSERLALFFPAQSAAGVGAIAVATGYAALAGFAVPTQRALVMLVAGLAMLLGGRRSGLAEALGAALIAVLWLDPLCVLAAGFWLSFAAVAAMGWAAASRGKLGRAGRWAGTQAALGLGLAPLTLWLFGQVSLVAPLANLVAVPLVALLAVPLALGGALCAAASCPLDGWLLGTACWLVERTLDWAAWLATPDWAVWQPPEPGWPRRLLALTGAAWLLAPRGVPARGLGVALLAPAVTFVPSAPGPGAFWLTVLDTGQGLACIVRTHGHSLVYDTGPRYGDGFDAGRAVVLPALRQLGIRRLDTLLVSHGDGDHAGGAPSILAGIPAGVVLAGEGVTLPGQLRCRDGLAWTWDGVRFRTVHPLPGTGVRGNSGSCVLHVSGARLSALLPGDIEADAERELTAATGLPLAASVLVAPHHGSRSSSTEAFIEHVAPRLVVFSAAWRGRYHHPDGAVAARYRAHGARTLNTATSGAVTIRPGAHGPVFEEQRRRSRRYWSAPE